MDGKWGGGNTLRWPYFAICCLDNESKLRLLAHAFAVSESHAAYKYGLCLRLPTVLWGRALHTIKTTQFLRGYTYALTSCNV